MNFFRSILSEDPDPQVAEKPQMSAPESPTNPSQEHHGDEPSSNPNPAAGGGGWSFGGLMKTLSTRSESVIETYRRDLREFGSGLQKETAVFREAASRAVKDLPAPVEVWKSTAEIISHGKEALLAPSDSESDSNLHSYSNQGLSSKKYSRFDAQLISIQTDPNTYCEEPEDLEDYNKWKSGFVMEEKSEEIKSLVDENGDLDGVYKRVVPNVVDHDTFWCRYFYRVHKLKQQEKVRANLVKRAISTDFDEELTWDVDDEDDEEGTNGAPKGNAVMVDDKESGGKELPRVLEESGTNEAEVGGSKNVETNVGNVSKGIVTETSSEKEKNEDSPSEQTYDKVENKTNVDEKIVAEKRSEEMNEEVLSEETLEVNEADPVSGSDEKVDSDGKVENVESCKDSDVSIVSTQPSLPEEEDLGWDEIEDIGSNDDKKGRNAGSPNMADLRKRLSAADDDEDLNWDIEDDEEEPVSKPGSK